MARAWASKYGEESVTGRLDLPPPVGAQLPANQLVVTVQHVAPAPVPHLRGPFRGRDDGHCTPREAHAAAMEAKAA